MLMRMLLLLLLLSWLTLDTLVLLGFAKAINCLGQTSLCLWSFHVELRVKRHVFLHEMESGAFTAFRGYQNILFICLIHVWGWFGPLIRRLLLECCRVEWLLKVKVMAWGTSLVRRLLSCLSLSFKVLLLNFTLMALSFEHLLCLRISRCLIQVALLLAEVVIRGGCHCVSWRSFSNSVCSIFVKVVGNLDKLHELGVRRGVSRRLVRLEAPLCALVVVCSNDVNGRIVLHPLKSELGGASCLKLRYQVLSLLLDLLVYFLGNRT